MTDNQSVELDKLFDEYYPIGTVVANDKIDEEKADTMTLIIKHRRDTFKAKLHQLLIKERIKTRKEVALDNYQGQTFSDSTNYKAKFDKLIRNNELVIKRLQSQLNKEQL